MTPSTKLEMFRRALLALALTAAVVLAGVVLAQKVRMEPGPLPVMEK